MEEEAVGGGRGGGGEREGRDFGEGVVLFHFEFFSYFFFKE